MNNTTQRLKRGVGSRNLIFKAASNGNKYGPDTAKLLAEFKRNKFNVSIAFLNIHSLLFQKKMLHSLDIFLLKLA